MLSIRVPYRLKDMVYRLTIEFLYIHDGSSTVVVGDPRSAGGRQGPAGLAMSSSSITEAIFLKGAKCTRMTKGIAMLKLKSFLADESGAVSVEYGFAIVFAAAIASVILTQLQNEVSTAFQAVDTKLTKKIDAAIAN